MALARLVLITLGAWENKECVVAIMLDLLKAFDTLEHDILLDKLTSFGIVGPAHSWL